MDNQSITGVIYKTTNLINGKIYVGQTARHLPNYYGSGTWIKRSIKKYGLSAFEKEVLEECNSEMELDEREIYWIDKLNATDPQIGYNLKTGGSQGGRGNKFPEESKWMLRRTHIGKIYINNMIEEIRVAKEELSYYLENGWKLGRKYRASEDTKKKMSNSTNKTVQIYRNNVCKRVDKDKVNDYIDDGWKVGVGHQYSEEERKLIGLRSRGRIVSEQEREAISKRHKGKIVSEEIRLKQSKARIDKGLAAGSNNPKAREINIYNENDELVYKCHGNFLKTIKENGLSQTLKTTLAKGTKIERSKMTRIEKCIGWYARYVNEGE